MAVDAFLQFKDGGVSAADGAQGIRGETMDAFFAAKDPPPFEIQQWSFGASNTSQIGSATGGAGGGKAQFEPFKVTKNIDTSSSNLMLTCCAGGHYKNLVLWVRKTGASPTSSGEPYLQWEFKMAFVQNLAWTHADPQPTEEVTFVYGAIKFTYKAQKPDGGLEEPGIDRSWSQVMNHQDFDVPDGS